MKRKKPFLPISEFHQLLTRFKLKDPLIEEALKIAGKTHRNARRDDGTPYLDQHVFPVISDTLKYFADTKPLHKKIVIVGLLHDVLEDSSTVSSEKLLKKFGEELHKDILFLNKPRKQEGYRTQKVKHSEHKDFIKQLSVAPFYIKVMKCFDRLNNIVCTEMHLMEKKYARFINDTKEYYLPFAKEIDKRLFGEMNEGLNKLIE